MVPLASKSDLILISGISVMMKPLNVLGFNLEVFKNDRSLRGKVQEGEGI